MSLNQHLPSHLGEVPSDWERVILSDIMKVRQGLQISISERLQKPTETSKEYITIQSIKKTEQAREYVEAPSKRVICGKEDVLMTRTGNTGIVVTDVEGVFHNNFFLMDFDRNQIDRKFLVNYLRTTRVQHLILTKAGASTIPDLNHKDFYSIEFPLAPLLEQRKIASILCTWDKAISTTERLIDNRKQQKKALMQQLLTGNKRLFDDSGKPFEGEWKEVTLGKVTKFIKDGTHGTHKRYDFGVPMLSAVNITKNHKIRFVGAPNISEEDYRKIHGKYEITEGDILLTVVGTLGRVAIVSKTEKFTLQRSVAIIRVLDDLSNQFLMQLFSSSNFTHLLITKSNSTAQAGVYLGELAKIKLSIPSLEEQQKIATVLTNADKEIELLEQQLSDLKQEKKALMQQLLTGKRRVNI